MKLLLSCSKVKGLHQFDIQEISRQRPVGLA
jgi:hypothetical protein